MEGLKGRENVAIIISKIKPKSSNEVDLFNISIFFNLVFCLRVVFIQGLHHIWDTGPNSQFLVLNLIQKVSVFQGSVTGPLAWLPLVL